MIVLGRRASLVDESLLKDHVTIAKFHLCYCRAVFCANFCDGDLSAVFDVLGESLGFESDDRLTRHAFLVYMEDTVKVLQEDTGTFSFVFCYI